MTAEDLTIDRPYTMADRLATFARHVGGELASVHGLADARVAIVDRGRAAEVELYEVLGRIDLADLYPDGLGLAWAYSFTRDGQTTPTQDALIAATADRIADTCAAWFAEPDE